jgi:hypothetical protein
VKGFILERINWVVLHLPMDIPLLALGNIGQQLLRVHIDGLKMVEFADEKVVGDHFITHSTNDRYFL